MDDTLTTAVNAASAKARQMIAQLGDRVTQTETLIAELRALATQRPEELTPRECMHRADAITRKRQELGDCINSLYVVQHPSSVWVELYNGPLNQLDARYQSRYKDWKAEQEEENARQERIRAFEAEERAEEDRKARLRRGELV